MAARVPVGTDQVDGVALADVPALGAGEVAAEQREGEGVALNLPAGCDQLRVVRADGGGAGSGRAPGVEQGGAVGIAPGAGPCLGGK
jgi:hypothetical protein